MSGAMRTAIMSFATSAPRRMPMSKRSATMSANRLSLLTSMWISGYCRGHGNSRGQTNVRTACSVAVMRAVPIGLPRSSPSTDSSDSISASRGATVWNKRSPASVGAGLRVVRFNSFRSIRRSSDRTVWLSGEVIETFH